MIANVFSWLDARTDYQRYLLPIRRRTLPGGARWEYSTAACLLWLLVIQAVTGFLLMATYSPSSNSAWASVHYIEHSPSGSFIRGLHYYAAHALIVMFAIHTIRVLLQAGFRKPRELIWITGLVLIPLLIVWAITGNPLAGSIKGMAQIEVEGSIIGSTPVIGPIVQRILIGGDDVGHLTLTHLYFLHVALCPLLVGLLLVVHINQVYRHGLSTPLRPGAATVPYWPHQTFRNMVVLAVVLSGIALLAWLLKAPLDAPADAQLAHTPRPEWYLLFLFELRRYFTGNYEFVATLLLPATAGLVLLLMPVIDLRCSPQTSRRLRALIVLLGVGTWGGLTVASVIRDWRDPEYQLARAQSDELSHRARELADSEVIPPEGAASLLQNDPKTQGPLLFERHCSSCHSYLNEQGQGIQAEAASAPNLYGFATTKWIAGLLAPDQINGPHYFGQTKFADGDMVGAINSLFEAAESDAAKAELKADLARAARALSAEAKLTSQSDDDHRDEAAIESGAALITKKLGCVDCHRFHDQGDLGSAPDLTGYGSRAWLTAMISDPRQERFYAGDKNDRMPAFAESTSEPHANLLSPRELSLLVDWLRGDWYRPTEANDAP